MPTPAAIILGAATLVIVALGLALFLGLISPKRFGQLLGGGACGLTLVCTGIWLADGGGHG